MQITRRVSLLDKDDFYKFWYTQSKHNLLCFRQSLWQIFEVRMVLGDNKILNLQRLSNKRVVLVLLTFDLVIRIGKLSHTNFRFSALITSRATLVLVWPGHDSWENSYTDSRLSTLMQLLFIFDKDTRVTNFCLSTLINSHATLVHIWQGYKDMRVV